MKTNIRYKSNISNEVRMSVCGKFGMQLQLILVYMFAVTFILSA